MGVQLYMSPEVSVVWDMRIKELRMYTDFGRCSRPLFIVEDNQLLIKRRHVLETQQVGPPHELGLSGTLGPSCGASCAGAQG